MFRPARPLALAAALLAALAGGASSDEASASPSRPTAATRRPPTRRAPARPRPSRDPAPADDDPALTRDVILATSASESIGRAAQGRLRNGLALEDGDHVEVLRGSEDTDFGTVELVQLIESGARHVSERFPGARLHVGDLSRRGGGHLGSHRSHRSGRDADVGFYMNDAAGQPLAQRFFVRFDREGNGRTGWSREAVVFDVARNWALLEGMMNFGGAQLQYVFVSEPLQALLLAEAERQGASPETIARATELMSHNAGGHDNHFHIRIHCPASDSQCIDNEPPRRRRPSGSRSGTRPPASRRPASH